MSTDGRMLAETLRRLPLLTPTQQTELAQKLPSCGDAKILARHMLDRGWLTSFQLNQVFMGRAAELVLGSYVLLERLGEGGTGQVFKARHQHMNRIVALKLIRKELLADKEVVARFHREIQLVSTLTHPHVVHAYDAGPIGANYFLVMEYVEGTDLARILKRSGALPVEQACDYVRQAALGLQHVHAKSLVHRDVKPSNLLVTPATDPEHGYGLVKILDLGLARLQHPVSSEVTHNLTSTGPVMMGTLDYLAPEQAIDFHTVDIRADVYSLGCTLYQLLTAQAPFPGGTVAQKLMKHQQAEPQPLEKLRPGLPPAVTAVVRKMMAKQPEDRFQEPGEVATALGARAGVHLPAVIGPRPVQALLVAPEEARRRRPDFVVIDGHVESTTQRLTRQLTPVLVTGGRFAWRHPKLSGAVAGVLMFACAGFLLSLFLLFRPRSAAVADAVATAPAPSPVRAPEAPVDVPTPASVPLSDLPESNFQGSAFGKKGHLGHNGNGNLPGVSTQSARIIVNGLLSPQGVSMLAPSGGAALVQYHLDKHYKTFKSGVGLHDGGWMSGSKVTFVIIGDGKVLWRSSPIGGKMDYPQTCNVSVDGVSLLELQVTCSSSNNGVWPVWVDPNLSK